MQLYSDFARPRTAQIVGDVVAVAVAGAGIVAAVSLHDAIAGFTGIGAEVTRSGDGFAATMSEIGSRLGGVPLVGSGIRAPFESASTAGGALADAGTSWQQGVERLATLVGWTVALLVLLLVLAGWVRPRLVGAVRRGAVARLAAAPGSDELLALRALTSRPAGAVTALGPDVVTAWRRGDTRVIERLAALELRGSGVRSPAR